MVAKVMRGRARVRGEVCSNPRGEEPGEETEEESRYKKLNDLQGKKAYFFFSLDNMINEILILIN